MSAAHASLEGAFSEHDPHQLVGFVIIHGQHVDFGLHFSFGQSLHSIGGVNQHSIVLVGADKGKGSVFGVVVDGVLVVGVGFCEGGDSGDITLAHVLEGEGVEVGGIVVHF